MYEDALEIQTSDSVVIQATARLVEGGPTAAEVSDASARGILLEGAQSSFEDYLGLELASVSFQALEGLEGLTVDLVGLSLVGGFLLIGVIIALSAVKRPEPSVI